MKSAESYNHLLQSIVDNHPAAIWVKDFSGHYLMCNRAAEHVLERERAMLLESEGEAWLNHEQQEILKLSEKKLLEIPEPSEIHVVWPTADEKQHFTFYRFLIDEKIYNRPAYCCIATDISDLFEVTQDLVTSHTRLKLAMSSGGFGAWDWNVPKNRFVWDNNMFQLFGIDSRPNMDALEIFKSHLIAGEFDRIKKQIEESFKKRTLFDSEFRILRTDGKTRTLRALGRGFRDSSGQAEILTGLCWDVTEKYVREQQLVNNFKMASLGVLVSGIAHEVNNPLTVVLNQLYITRRLLESSNFDRNKVLNSIDAIERNTNRVVKIIGGLRTFARESTGDPFENACVDRIIEDVSSLLDAKVKGLPIKIDLPKVKPNLKIKCRPSEISQVLYNLIANACDAVMSLKDRWVRLEIAEEPQELIFRVVDSGKGLSRELADKVFLPFFTTKEVGKGTGLGLSLAQGIAEAHGGSLHVDSHSGNTTFVLVLPKKPD